MVVRGRKPTRLQQPLILYVFRCSQWKSSFLQYLLTIRYRFFWLRCLRIMCEMGPLPPQTRTSRIQVFCSGRVITPSSVRRPTFTSRAVTGWWQCHKGGSVVGTAANRVTLLPAQVIRQSPINRDQSTNRRIYFTEWLRSAGSDSPNNNNSGRVS